MSRKAWKVVPLVFLAAQIIFAATYTVSQVDGEGMFTSVQAAVKAAGADGSGDGDTVEILDKAIYEEQVTIDSTCSGLTVRSSNPTGTSFVKPTIRHQDKENVHPLTCEESKVHQEKAFDMNGALRVMRARNVTIDGLIVDAVEPWIFGANGVWKGSQDCEWPLQHGNGGVTLFVAGDVVVRNCDIKNAYMGIAVKDRNEGGIYANANTGDVAPENIVPRAGFGKTGNHLIENNRIHNNSFGVYFESTWDLGSVIRYNLIYENHHPTTEFAQDVKDLTGEGKNQAGGAIAFKDHSLSPIAIYNNTFYKNFIFFVGGWRPAYHCLIFNNIFSRPFKYLEESRTELVFDSWFELSAKFLNRMHNCVYAAQAKEPTDGQVQMGIDMQVVQPIVPGASIKPNEGTFPATANIRWYETPFLSEDPDDPLFLTPDWSVANVQKFILDQGWAEAGILDDDGTIADLGAIPMSAVTPQTEVLIKPEAPIFISGTEATVDFKVYSIAGEMTNPQIKYMKWVNLEFQDKFAKEGDPIAAADIINIAPQPVKMGSNSFSFNVPASAAGGTYAFVELIIEGTSADGKQVASSIGFLPFRVIDYKFEVEIYDATGATKLTEVTAGVPVQLKVTPLKKDGSPIMANIKPIAVSLSSKYNVYSAPNDTVFFPNGVTGPSTSSIIFTKVPDVGTDRVTVNGKYGLEAISGISDAIKINPGDPAKVKFQNPPSGATGKVNPGLSAPVAVQVYDAYDNKVNKPAQATLTSANPGKISVVEPATVTTDENGLATFHVEVGLQGNPNDSASINVALVVKPDAQDNAWMKVGRARDRFVIFYSDTLGFDPSVVISTCAGQRVPVTIRALVFDAVTGKDSLVTSRSNKFDIILTPGLEAYSSLSELDATPITQANLVSGQAVIWVKANQAVDNGMLTITAAGDNSITKGERENISFLLCKTSIARASYHADNGQGQVDRLEVFFKDTIKATDIPDSIQLFWPNTDAANGKWVYKRTHYPETPDPADPMHITVNVQPPFAAGVTFSPILQLGTAYVRDADGVSRPNPFSIADSVGPLLMTAELVERLPENATGVDTIYISLSESVASSLIQGGTLTLIKHAGATEVPLTIQNAVGMGDVTRLIVANEGTNSPAGGDQLKILASGTIRDQFGNAAHADNRPVIITVRAIPPDIAGAWYEDADANGIVEKVTVDFNKNVSTAFLGVYLKWPQPANETSDTLKAALFSYPNAADSSIVEINVLNQFRSQNFVVNKTDVQMTIDPAVFYNFPGVTRNKNVLDKAAPVLDSMTLAPGEALSETENAPDTLIADFSEAVTILDQAAKTPYTFYPSTGTPYALSLTFFKQMNNKVIYLVENTGANPQKSDSVNVAVPASPLFQDLEGNILNNPANKKVPLTIKPMKYPVKVRVGPNPFNPMLGGVTRIEIKPVTSKAEMAVIDATITIFDPLGNKVHEEKKIGQQQMCEFTWDGSNKKGRKVGTGVYMARVKGKDLTSNKAIDEIFYIAIKR